jgi:hypothetical protein
MQKEFWLGNLSETTTCATRRRWEDTIKMNLRKIYCGNGRWMELAKDSVRLRGLVLVVLKLRFLQNIVT